MNNKFPRYFNINDLLVKIDLDKSTNEVFGATSKGKPYPPAKVFLEGHEITQSEFDNLASNSR